MVSGLLVFSVVTIMVYILLRTFTDVPDGVLVAGSVLAGFLGEWLFYRIRLT
ncbi:hypothetical protein Bsel_1532 [[Bacillus] selenitireducens MLS10]|uniref:Uncharacterized protein n=1 Tax=Bacillus selenitireducens (strain ATCC 700615 / DSM 15326 / MLS10) TaxID=439292 RepID=D6XTA8_BACIE|nr:hypothetical protein Bsel_1532 [[Bacillus] selenitireducens MLS10]